MHFTHMDQNEYMCTRTSGTRPFGHQSEYTGGGAKATEKALELLNHLRQRSGVAHGWAKTIFNLESKFNVYKKDYRESRLEGYSSSSTEGGYSRYGTHHLSICDTDGGGLEEWQSVEKLLTEFGNIGAKDSTPPGESERNGIRNGTADRDSISDQAPSMVKSESMAPDATSPRARQDGWSAINSTPGDSQARDSKYGLSSNIYEGNGSLNQTAYQRPFHPAGYQSSSATPSFHSTNTAPSEPSPLVSPTGRSLSNPITPAGQDHSWIPPIPPAHHHAYSNSQLSPQSSISIHSQHASMNKGMQSMAEMAHSDMALVSPGATTGYSQADLPLWNTSITADDWVLFTYGMDALNNGGQVLPGNLDQSWIQKIQN
jgi:hypothetical protein